MKVGYRGTLERPVVACGLAVFSLLVWAAGCVPPLVKRDTSVSVLVFNIHAGKDAAGKDNLDGVATLVKQTQPDFVLLQEVDRGTNRSGKVDQLQVLIDKTGYQGVFGRTLDYDGGQYGIAALSKEGFAFADTVSLPVSPVQTRAGGSYEPRGAQVLTVYTDHGRLQAINTHLDASSEDTFRLQEIQQLRIHVRARLSPLTPVMLGGDLNAEPGSELIKRFLEAGLRDAWTECGQGDGFTYPADAPRKRIDYVWLSGSLRCTSARVLDTQVSDHRPLLVRFEGLSSQ